MSGSPSLLPSLRRLLTERFPQAARSRAGVVPTGVGAIDEALGGGLPSGALTELVSTARSGGGQSVFASLLGRTREARQRVALVDGADGFDPSALPPDCLRHLVWVRCGGADPMFAAADILLRDGNYAAVVLDARGMAERRLRRAPSSLWHRLRGAAEGGGAAVLVQTDFPLVPAAPLRLILGESLRLSASERTREEVAAALTAELARGVDRREARVA